MFSWFDSREANSYIFLYDLYSLKFLTTKNTKTFAKLRKTTRRFTKNETIWKWNKSSIWCETFPSREGLGVCYLKYEVRSTIYDIRSSIFHVQHSLFNIYFNNSEFWTRNKEQWILVWSDFFDFLIFLIWFKIFNHKDHKVLR